MNLIDLEDYLNKKLEKKLVEKNAGIFTVDGKKCGLFKILGRGNTAIKIEAVNVQATKEAKEKIESLGGKIQ